MPATTELGPRFAKVVALLDSPVDGEAAAAFARATDMLRKAGKRWADVIAPAGPTIVAYADVPRGAWPKESRQSKAPPVADYIKLSRETILFGDLNKLSRWEQHFLRDIAATWTNDRLSDKQRRTVLELYDQAQTAKRAASV